MDFASVPIIVVCCYIVGELYKLIFKNKQQTYKFIPVILSVVGGLLGILMFFTNPEMLPVQNAWIAFGVGIVSGSSATGANQIVKQLFTKEEGIRDGETSESKDIVSSEQKSVENSAKEQE